MTQDLINELSPWKTVTVPKGYVLRMAGLGFRPTDEDIAGDVDRLSKSLVANSTDASNIHLHGDEMHGEMMLKVAQILNRRDLFFSDRGSFFGFLKVSLMRHKKTLIQRYAFTMKRTGIKPRDRRGDRCVETVRVNEHLRAHAQGDPHPCNPHDNDPHKPVKISLDDDGVSNHFGVESGREHTEAVEMVEKFISTYLTPIEALVIRQELEPENAAYSYAFVEHKDSGKSRKFKIRDAHKARGLGMELHAYKKVLNRIRTKMAVLRGNKNMSANIELQAERLAELQLCEIFNVQVPAHVDSVVRRRCFTLAARDNMEKLSPEVARLLEAVGAYIPKKHGDTVSCFGVLYEANHRGCKLCALEDACKTRAANVGLGSSDFQVDKRLLGARCTKTPMILPKIDPPQENEEPVKVANLTVLWQCDRDEEVLEFLIETMVPVLYGGEIFYRLPDKGNKRVFCVGQPERVMKLRFCNPSDKLKKKLVSYGQGPMWSAPDDMSLKDVKSLMNEHISNQLK